MRVGSNPNTKNHLDIYGWTRGPSYEENRRLPPIIEFLSSESLGLGQNPS